MGLGVKMRKAKKFRTLKELYEVTSQVEQPKSTPVWEGNCTFRGPVDEMEGSDQMDMGLCGTEEQLGRRFQSNKCNESEETGACNGIKDEASAGKEASRCCFDDANVFCGSKSGSLNDKHHACSETSNPLSSCSSSHNSFSENADSKSVPRGADMSEAMNCVLLDQHNKQKELELLGDNVSCVSRADGTDVMLDDHRTDASRNNLSCSSASVNSFPADLKLEVDCHERPIGIIEGSTNGFSDLPKKLECTEELSESTLTKVTSVAVGGQMYGVHSYSESLEPVAEIENIELSTDALICSDRKVHSGNTYIMLEEPKTLESLPSQPDINVNGATIQEIDVKVCDICGDEGHRHKLATCSKCSDGAEHIYCMRTKLDKVPEGNWVCEVCTLKEEKENPNKVKFDKPSILSRKLSFNKARHDCKVSSALKLNNHVSSDVKCLTVEKGGTSKTGFTSHCSAKRSGINLQGGLMKKRRVHETSIGSSGMSSPSQATALHRDSQCKSLDKGKTMVTGKKISLDDHTSRIFKPVGGTSLGDHTSYKNSGKSVLHSHSVKSKPHNFEGHLYKSKSFNGAYSKVGVKLPVQGGPNGPKVTKHVATSESKNVGNLRRMEKSKSFNNASSHHFDVGHTKLKMVSDEVEKLKHAKEWSSSRIGYTSKSKEQVPACGASPLASDRRLTTNGTSTSQPTLVSKSLDMKTSKCPGDSNGSLGRRSHLVETCSKHSNKSKELVADNVRLKGELPKIALDVVIPDKGAVPELDYIWRGGFELKRSEKLASSYDGFQAHLSTCASPKVLEVVDKLPHKIMLEEVPRSSAWPTQFLMNPVTENNIALYFFAKDIRSYERDYRILLECMTKNDLALKGNVDGIELLIFSSSLLPQEVQCWNRLLFLWGLFRVRRSGHVSNSEKKTSTTKSESIPTSQDKTSNPSLNVISLENCVLNSQPISNVGRNLCAPNSEHKPDPSEKMSVPNPISATPNKMSIPAISRCLDSCSSSQLIGSISSSITSYNMQQVSSSINSLPWEPVSPGSVLKVCKPKASTTEQKSSSLPANCSEQPSVDNTIQNEQLSEDVLPFRTMLKDSKRRLEIDLNSCCEEQITDSAEVYEEQEPKRTKNCLNAVSESSTETKDLGDKTMFRINGISPGFSVEDKTTEACKEEKNNTHWRVVATKGKGNMEMPTPNLELSLCSETKRPAIDLELSLGAEDLSDGVMFGMVAQNKSNDKYSALASSTSGMPLGAPYQLLPEGRKSLSLFGHRLIV